MGRRKRTFKKGSGIRGKTPEEVLEIYQKQDMAYSLKTMGFTDQAIATQLGYYDHTHARYAIEASGKRRHAMNADEMRTTLHDRAEEITRYFWPKLREADPDAGHVVAKFAHMQAKIWGCYVAEKRTSTVHMTHELKEPDPEVLAKIEQDNQDPLIAARVLAELEAAGAFGLLPGGKLIDVTPEQVDETPEERPWEPGPRGMGSAPY